MLFAGVALAVVLAVASIDFCKRWMAIGFGTGTGSKTRTSDTRNVKVMSCDVTAQCVVTSLFCWLQYDIRY